MTVKPSRARGFALAGREGSGQSWGRRERGCEVEMMRKSWNEGGSVAKAFARWRLEVQVHSKTLGQIG